MDKLELSLWFFSQLSSPNPQLVPPPSLLIPRACVEDLRAPPCRSIAVIVLKANVPEALKADLPQSKWGKILSGTPVVLAVVSTMLAGLASSEMTKAQYDRSFAAQLQSKAGDQWSFFQAKRLRSALQNNTLDLLLASAGRRTLDPAALRSAFAGSPAIAALDSPAGLQTLTVLNEGTLPKLPPAPPPPESIHATLRAIETARPDEEITIHLAKVEAASLEQAVRDARRQTLALDALLKPISQVIDALEQNADRPSVDAALRRDFVAARLGYNARRYDLEARLNQSVAGLYELQVRKANLSSERHHRRSQRFFFGMLAAQTGVIVSTLAIAARQRNLLWTLAAIFGAAAVAFALHVYLYV